MENEELNTPQQPTTPGAPDEPHTPTPPTQQSKLRAYKAVCAKLGVVMTVFFACRLLGGLMASWMGGFTGGMNHTEAYALNVLLSIFMSYLIPMSVAVIVFRSFKYYGENGGLAALYKKPRRIARALGTFPAMYGLGYGTVILTLIASYFILRATGGQHIIQDILRPNAIEPPGDIASVLMMMFLLVVIAPVFEEFWVRGIMYDALKPYGCGMAIIISSVLFGLMHGSLDKLFFTTALGFALGYVRYATGSIFICTILHAIFNSVSAMLLFLLSMAEITHYDNKLLNTMLYIYVFAVLILVVIGLVVFIRKIPVIRKYRVENGWDEVGAGKKTALFFVSIPVIIMMIFAANEHLQGLLLRLVIR